MPVLLNSVIRLLAPKAGDVYVDATAGLGGHAAAIGEVMARDGGTGTVVLNDVDPGNLERAAARVRDVAGDSIRIVSIRGNFAELPGKLRQAGIRANMFLADLGFSSNQMDDPARGFSFNRDGPLDMRLDPSLGMSAADFVNSADERELTEIIDRYGEERMARVVARKIVQSRKVGPIMTTGRLAELVRSVVPQSWGADGAARADPATRTFQALRIAVNDELGVLEALLRRVEDECRRPGSGEVTGEQEPGWLAEGARLAIISFHSLEDRLVKRVFAEMCRVGKDELSPGRGAAEASKGIVEAGEDEMRGNPRSRSAKMRVIRIGG